jgi:hypothetical protein
MLGVSPARPEWASRGRVCRDRRVNGTPYRTQRELAAVVGVSMVEVSKMEAGILAPSRLEAWWANLPTATAGPSPDRPARRSGPTP